MPTSWNDLFFRRRKWHCSLCREQPEGETFLQVKPDAGLGMTKITDGYVLAEIQFEITPPGGKYEAPPDCRSPDNIPINKRLDMFQNRITFITAAADSRVGLGAKHERIGAVDPGKP